MPGLKNVSERCSFWKQIRHCNLPKPWMPHKYSNGFTYGIISSCHAHATFLFLCSHCGVMELKETLAHSPVNKMHFHWCVYSWTYTEVRIVSLNKCLWSCMHAVICIRCAGGKKTGAALCLLCWISFKSYIRNWRFLTRIVSFGKVLLERLLAACVECDIQGKVSCTAGALLSQNFLKHNPPPHPPSSSSSL